MRRSKGNMFWGDVRRGRKSATVTVLMATCVVVVMMMVTVVEVESASVSVGEVGGVDARVNREGFAGEGLRNLEEAERQRERELADLRQMKILMMTSGQAGEGRINNDEDEIEDEERAFVDEHAVGVGGDDDDADDNEDEGPFPGLTHVVREKGEEEILPESLEAAGLLLEKYKQRMEDEHKMKSGGDREEEDGEEPRHLHHFHNPRTHHHRHPPSPVRYQEEEEEELQEPQESQNIPVAVPASPPHRNMQMSRVQGGRSLWASDFEKKTSELCGTSASLECGKRILRLIEGQEMSELSIHMKCDLRDDFLKCIDTQKRVCLELATKSSMLPQLPPKEAIKMERTKLWRVLWTAGGCVLAD